MDPRRVFPLYQRHVQTKILKLVGFMDKHVGVTGGFSARKLGTLECLQENLTNQLSRMEKDWDEVKCNFHWSQTGMEVVFNDTEKVVDDSRALVNEVLVKTEVQNHGHGPNYLLCQDPCDSVSAAEVKLCLDPGGV
jgi:hypothetical protein